ncbi:MAG: cellulase family glycosylhydrolase [Bacteroidales bacterium]|nr:cellulase family glycosylhydrolase [Bacteroidales bacterium]
MNRLITTFAIGFSILLLAGCGNTKKNECHTPGTRWDTARANQWYAQYPWLAGANFNPSTAINQLETWQAESFDTETIDRELGWASGIGFNCMRVYLHHLAWQTDKEGFKKRMDTYLGIAEKHGIHTLFVFFDDCWNSEYQAGKQPEPKTGVHNSGWVQDPGKALYNEDGTINEELMAVLEEYVKDVLATFKNDQRILGWDLYNEPGNSGYGNKSMYLLEKVFDWGREVNPNQPLTAGVWNINLPDLNKFQVEHSDIITYHNYNDEKHHQSAIDTLKLINRPMICTEYMARTNNSRFENIMPILKQQNIGAINWGLVSGKSNTIYAWDTPVPDGSEPELWFHDVFRKTGEPYNTNEIALIKSLTAK